MKKWTYIILACLLAFPLMVKAQDNDMPSNVYEALKQIQIINGQIQKQKIAPDTEQGQQLSEQVNRYKEGIAKGYIVILFSTQGCMLCQDVKDKMNKKSEDETTFLSRLKSKNVRVYEINDTHQFKNLVRYYVRPEKTRHGETYLYPKLIVLKDGIIQAHASADNIYEFGAMNILTHVESMIL